MRANFGKMKRKRTKKRPQTTKENNKTKSCKDLVVGLDEHIVTDNNI